MKSSAVRREVGDRWWTRESRIACGPRVFHERVMLQGTDRKGRPLGSLRHSRLTSKTARWHFPIVAPPPPPDRGKSFDDGGGCSAGRNAPNARAACNLFNRDNCTHTYFLLFHLVPNRFPSLLVDYSTSPYALLSFLKF